MRRVSILGWALLLSSLSPCIAWADQTNKWSATSDLLAVGLPAVAGLMAYTEGDSEGLKQLALAQASTVASSEVLKGLFKAPRPNGSNNRSFPSGHTAVAFSAASYVDLRYGSGLGLWRPVLYGVAGLVGVGRVEAKEHRWVDVIGGAALGYGITAYWAESSQAGRLVVLPSPGGLGLAWQQSF